MGRIFAMALFVLVIWVAAEVYTKGMGGAFGGIFGSLSDAPANRSTPDRAADALQRAYNTSEERVDRLLEREGSAD